MGPVVRPPPLYAFVPPPPKEKFELRDGDRVVFLGDTFIEREQTYGFIEGRMIVRYPDRNLIFRNLGWSADTPLGESRAGFDPPERGFDRVKEQVAELKPTVVFLGYGMASSFAGAEGVAKFKADMNQLIDTIQQICQGIPVRFVVIGPIRHEALGPPLPSPVKHNEQLALYSKALHDLADQRGYPFVPLFDMFAGTTPGKGQFPLTDNGIHLNYYGYSRVAEAIEMALGWDANTWRISILRDGRLREGAYGTQVTDIKRTDTSASYSFTELLVPAPAAYDKDGPMPAATPMNMMQFVGLTPGRYGMKLDGKVVESAGNLQWNSGRYIFRGAPFDQAEQLRQTVVRKNQLFFYRWRPQNVTYLFGFRRNEQGQNAREVPMFDPLIKAEEDKIAVLRKPVKHTVELTLESLPGATNAPVVTRQSGGSISPADAADGAQVNVSVTSSAATPYNAPPLPLPEFEVAPGFEVNLFAENPLLAKPIQMNFDPQGRLWIASSAVYPQIKPGEEANDRILVLEDTKGVGQADKATVFADGLLMPTAVVPGDGGAYVGQSTQLLFLKDTDGDGKADLKKVILSGFGTEDTHHIIHTLRWGLDGQLYFNQSIYIHSHLETPNGVVRLNSGGIFHLRPPTMELGVFLRGFCNPWGHDFDPFGQSFVTDGAGFQGVSYGVPGAMYFTYAGGRRILDSISPGNYPKFASLELVRSPQFPDDWQGNAITCDFRAHRVVRFAINEQGSSYLTTEMPDLLRTTNITFRPIDVKFGPDGALYIADWSNPIIQHGEVDFRDPRRDHEHGRIWRVTAKDRPLAPRLKLQRAPVNELFAAVLSSNAFTSRAASRVLTERGGAIVPYLNSWTAAQTNEPALLHALWLYQSINQVQTNLLTRLLEAKDPHIRAAATRVLSYWYDRVDDASALLAARVADEHPRVRLEAIRALSEIPTARSAELVLSVLDHPLDAFLEYALWLSVNDLAKPWLAAIQSGDWKIAGRERQLEYGLKAIEPALASSVLGQMKQAQALARDGSGPWIELIGQTGDANELRRLFDTVAQNGFDDPAAVRALNSLDAAARGRNARPAGDLAPLATLFQRRDPAVRAAAVRLAGGWRLAPAAPEILKLAGQADSSPELRAAAFDSLRAIGGPEVTAGLRQLAASGANGAVRRAAVGAFAALDLPGAVPSMIAVLKATTQEADALDLWRSLLSARGAGAKLAPALARETLPPVVVRVGVRVAREGGRAEPALVTALSHGQSTQDDTQGISDEAMRQLAARVNREGDPARGERVFRRPAVACVSCHAIGGAGGKVGPDLTSIGASSPLDYLIESVFYPNRKIKEGYQSVLVQTKDGQDLSGVFVRETPQELVLRNAANQELAVPKGAIESRAVGGSLMPSGLIDSLPDRDRLDLFRFLSELGKPGRYDASKGNLARAWRLFPLTTQNEQFGEDRIVGGPTDAAGWQTAYSLVDGQLSQADLREPLAPTRFAGAVGLYAATKFESSKAGPVRLRLAGADDRALWIDGKSVKPGQEVTTDLAAGTHTVVVRLDPKKLPENLRLESPDATFLTN